MSRFHRDLDQQTIRKNIALYDRPRRVPLSSACPFLRGPILFFRQQGNKLRNRLFFSLAKEKRLKNYPVCLARHQSVLRRKLGDSDQRLQEQKLVNLKRACQDLDGLIIQPDETFSLWETLGNPSYQRGYVDGMLLSNGKVIEGVGGGLCQLSNLLCWLFLHVPVAMVERHHHSMDVFPDSGRVLPFGSGATCLYNAVDLKVRNRSTQPLQLRLQVTATHLKGQIFAPHAEQVKYSLQQRDHFFVCHEGRYFRTNEIWRSTLAGGTVISEERLFSNFARVLYPVTQEYLHTHGHQAIQLS